MTVTVMENGLGSGLVRVISDSLGHIDNIVLVIVITLVEREAKGSGREEGTDNSRGTHLGDETVGISCFFDSGLSCAGSEISNLRASWVVSGTLN